MHTVVIAPDSFKGTIGAAEAAARLGEGWARVRPHDRVLLLPMADGGEGTIDAFATAVDGAQLWEITAVPELRVAARALAKQLLVRDRASAQIRRGMEALSRPWRPGIAAVGGAAVGLTRRRPSPTPRRCRG